MLRNPLLRNKCGQIRTSPRTKWFGLGQRQNHIFERGNSFWQDFYENQRHGQTSDMPSNPFLPSTLSMACHVNINSLINL